jgi:hypothetical protein
MAIDKRNPVDRKEFSEMASTVGISTPVAATTTVAGVVKQSATQADFAGADAAALVVELNAFLVKLKAAGIVA